MGLVVFPSNYPAIIILLEPYGQRLRPSLRDSTRALATNLDLRFSLQKPPLKRRCCFCAAARLAPETPVKPTTSDPVVRARAFRRIVATNKAIRTSGEMFSMATPSARSAPNAAIRAADATSSVHLALHKLETVVEQMATRLSRLERNHSSLRRRIVADKVAS
jgi:hypothetical protein